MQQFVLFCTNHKIHKARKHYMTTDAQSIHVSRLAMNE